MPPAVTITPCPDDWRSAMEAGHERAHNPAHRDDRATLGLPTDRPIVMSGHQPVLWHAGILAKLLASCELARATDAAVCWIVADMDEVDPTTVRVPDGRGAEARARIVRLLDGDPPAVGVPTGALDPMPAAPDDTAIDGLAPLIDAYAHEPTLALQMGHAVVWQACERFGLEAPTVIACSDLIRTDAWRTMLDAMRRDPAGCVDAYNRAAAGQPDAGIRPLGSSGDRLELPLWRVRPGMPRLAVFSDQLDEIPDAELRPRALTMTAIVRTALCDLFVHGTGGGVYDRVTEDWISAWLGTSLAPIAVATADVHADLGIDPEELPDPARAVWRAHHARHDPAMLGDDDAARTKRDLVERIASIKTSGDDPAPVFAELQELLRETREGHAARLDELDALAERARGMADVRKLATDRTWPWPTLPGASLDALHRSIRERFVPVPSGRCTDAASCSR